MLRYPFGVVFPLVVDLILILAKTARSTCIDNDRLTKTDVFRDNGSVFQSFNDIDLKTLFDYCTVAVLDLDGYIIGGCCLGHNADRVVGRVALLSCPFGI